LEIPAWWFTTSYTSCSRGSSRWI